MEALIAAADLDGETPITPQERFLIGNILKVQVSFAVPHLSLESLEGVMASIAVGHEGLWYALVVHAAFRLRGSSLAGYVVIVLSVASLDRLVRAVDQWEGERSSS